MRLRVTSVFVVVAAVLGISGARRHSHEVFVDPSSESKLQSAIDLLGPGATADDLDVGGKLLDQAIAGYPAIASPATGWVLAAGLAAAVVSVASVLLHELGHLAAARIVGIDVPAVELHAAGGFVEIDDSDQLTAGRLAAIVAAGPLVTGTLALGALALLAALGPAAGPPQAGTQAELLARGVLGFAATLNAAGLVVNLLPVRPLDGGHLMQAARLWRHRTRR